MNRSESNPLRRELAQRQHDGPHPDSDLLAAFSEGALLQDERQQVLAHLSACADCREVLSIAAAVAADSAGHLKPFLLGRPSNPAQRTWLPWASIAAGLLVVSTAALVYQQKLLLPKNTTVATKEAMQLPSSTISQPPPSLSVKKPEALSETAKSQRSNQLPAPSPSENTSVARAIPEAQIETARKSDFNQHRSYPTSADADEIATPGATSLRDAPARSASAFAGAAPAREVSNASMAAGVRPRWRINSLGQPERTFGDSAWQIVLPKEQSKMRVVSVFDNEVWIGGDNSRLYHSTDNGATWNLVVLPSKDNRERSIAHIHFQTAQSGTVECDDGTVWTTSNGGSTWK
ncbi:MAG: YCF48-related protein [Terracidiphilus sp.]